MSCILLLALHISVNILGFPLFIGFPSVQLNVDNAMHMNYHMQRHTTPYSTDGETRDIGASLEFHIRSVKFKQCIRP